MLATRKEKFYFQLTLQKRMIVMALKRTYWLVLFISVATLAIVFLPLVRVTRVITYASWFPDGTVKYEREETTEWISLYQFLLEGGQLLQNLNQSKSLDDLKKALNNVHFKLEYTIDSELQCGEKSAIIMKYLKEKGFIVEMARGKISRGDEEIPHAWVLVHLRDGTYVVETSTESGYPSIVGKVQEAAKGTIRYIEEERWSMETVEKKYKEILKKPLDTYLETEK
ncbi:hypothetical protein DRO54_10595 [Candidatus Bathyarchaeota archaeon]|nr:MAG: hypothetical protein DRO54_10595 [Candidatus Bathyarchaeota archaeon]